MTRCKATFTTRSGAVLQCENNSGHDSVHFCGDIWWPNKRGLPHTAERVSWLLRLLRRWLHK